MNSHLQHSLWEQRNSFAVLNAHLGPDYRKNYLPNGNDTSDAKTTVVYQMGSVPPGSTYDLPAILREHFVRMRATRVAIRRMITWRYFKRYSPRDMEKGVLWRILDLQGVYSTWYIGSSVSFESVKSVMEYNRMLIRMFIDPTQQWCHFWGDVIKNVMRRNLILWCNVMSMALGLKSVSN